MMLEKALGDILVTGGWICDDIPEFYAFNRLSFDDQLGPKHTLVKLTVNE
jgi:hypothetical protein